MFNVQIKETEPLATHYNTTERPSPKQNKSLLCCQTEITVIFGSSIYQREIIIICLVYAGMCHYWIFALNIGHCQEGTTC